MLKILICLLLVSTVQGFSQSSNRVFIETWITLCDSSAKPDINKDLYVIDGIPYKGADADRAINQLDVISDRIRIDLLNPNDTSWPFHHHPKGIIILITRRNRPLKRRTIKRELSELRFLFEQPVYKQDKLGHPNMINSSDQPVLMINDSTISHYNAWEVISKLKVRELEYIDYQEITPTLIYGENARNGLIRIWTKK